ncbi:MAG TPA: phosphoribosylanthranilate isomerase [Gemmatimonadaceae bacterium]|nr:phosphoribosylanthranilate isomerase [Gemmatimonadaceae bacterium]
MTRIKFCGLTRPEDAAHAESLGAEFGGVILSESPRRVDTSQAVEIFNAAPQLKRVGVVVREPIARLLKNAMTLRLDVIQLHGHLSHDEHASLRDEFDGDIWSVIGVDRDSGALSADWKNTADFADAILLDTSVAGRTGGTGAQFPWERAASLVKEISREIPVVLAGGLNPDNVEAAIGALHPAVVDVSSGVEISPGVKSPERMSAFAMAVASASIV